MSASKLLLLGNFELEKCQAERARVTGVMEIVFGGNDRRVTVSILAHASFQCVSLAKMRACPDCRFHVGEPSLSVW